MIHCLMLPNVLLPGHCVRVGFVVLSVWGCYSTVRDEKAARLLCAQ